MKVTGDAVDEESDVLKDIVNTESVEKVASILNIFLFVFMTLSWINFFRLYLVN